eukprot:jgi/Mesen1/7589/ME000395S06745
MSSEEASTRRLDGLPTRRRAPGVGPPKAPLGGQAAAPSAADTRRPQGSQLARWQLTLQSRPAAPGMCEGLVGGDGRAHVRPSKRAPPPPARSGGATAAPASAPPAKP